jgi:predicted AlkP superfamily phosphohydrolase/phosphomutase
MRKVPAIWNIAPEKKAAIIGWLNTWPAEKVNGIMVSPYVAIGSPKQVTIKGTVYPDIPHQVYPEERWEEICSLIVTPEKISDDLLNTFIEVPDKEVLSVFHILKRYIKGLRWSLAHTMTMRNITLHLLKTDSPDVTMVYFEGSDSLGHRFWLFSQSIQEIREQLKKAGYPPQYAGKLKKAFGNVMHQYYIKLDTIVGELTKEMGKNSNLIICSDHGFTKRSKDNPVTKYVPFTGEHRLEGTLFIHGPNIRPNKQIIGATLYSIAPTILDLLGITPPEEFEGTSLLRQVKNKGTTLQAQKNNVSDEDETVELPFTDEEMDRLRSLGYLN